MSRTVLSDWVRWHQWHYAFKSREPRASHSSHHPVVDHRTTHWPPPNHITPASIDPLTLLYHHYPLADWWNYSGNFFNIFIKMFLCIDYSTLVSVVWIFKDLSLFCTSKKVAPSKLCEDSEQKLGWELSYSIERWLWFDLSYFFINVFQSHTPGLDPSLPV